MSPGIVRRRRLLTVLMATPPALAFAQNRRPRAGWLVFGGSKLGPIDQTLLDALSDRGVVPGKNLDVQFHYAGGQAASLPSLADEAVREKPDLLIAIGGDLVRVLNTACQGRISIVGGVSDNPVRNGFAESLARPGKNFTGVAYLTDDLAGKRLELLTELAPKARRVATIWNPQHVDDEFLFATGAAEKLGLSLLSCPVNDMADVGIALNRVSEGKADSIFIIPSRLTNIAVEKIAPFARDSRLPIVTAWREMVVAGCLLSYGPSRTREARRLADIVARVLGGEKPGGIPVEQPTQFELVLNLGVAKAIGCPIPEALVARADEVIE